MTIKDASLAFNSGKYKSDSNTPPLLCIIQPKSTLKIYSGDDSLGDKNLKHVITTSLPMKEVLQGIVQRCDCSFIVGDDIIKDSKVYISSDFTPNSAESAFFWYPAMPTSLSSSSNNVDPAQDRATHDSDRIIFHPIQLNSSGQPACAFILPKIMEKGTVFTVPLFVRSESLGSVTISLRFQYVTKTTLTIPIETSFSMKVQIIRPLSMSFAISSNVEFPCGVIRDIGSPSTPVLQGSEITLSTTLTCLNALNKSISILDIVIEQHEDTSGIFSINEAQWRASGTSGPHEYICAD